MPTSGMSSAVAWAARASEDAAKARKFGNATGAFVSGPGDVWGVLAGVTGWND